MKRDADTGRSPSRSVAGADVTLKIPRPLYEQLKQVIEGSGFHSVTEFAVYVLRDLVSHRGHPVVPPPVAEPAPDVDPLSPDEIEAIRQRLTSLGYL
ncbi:MAG TPA: CopG family transcriptional regulator [Actinomycetota bacterium]|nr:CopG family transcriptional regulator [Actinomycetota bacterium]